MGFLTREKAVLGYLARGLAVVGDVLLGGQTRRRITLAADVSIGLIGYLWVGFGLERLVQDLLTLLFRVPAPGQPLNPTTWMQPATGLWPDVMALSRLVMAVSVLLLLGLGGRLTMVNDEAARRRELKRLGKMGLYLCSTWTVLPFGLHLADQLTMALTPSPEMVFSALIPSAATGVVLGIVAWIQPLFVAIGVLATVLLQAVILAGFVFWPIAWPLRLIEHDLATRLSRSITAALIAAVAGKVIQAISAFMLVHLTSSLGSMAVRALVFVVGVVVVFLTLPIVMLRYAEQVMLLPGALAPTEQQVGRYIEESTDRVGRAHERIEAGRERFNEWRETDPQTRLDGDWTTDDSSGLFDGWITHEISPSFTSAEWGGSATRSAMSDGVHGPESDDPDEVTNTQNTCTDQEQGRWDDR